MAPVHRCARSVCGVACTVSWAAWLLLTCVPAPVCCVVCKASWAPCFWFTGVHALCAVLCMRCPGPLGSCSLVRELVVLCRLCRGLGFLAPVLRRLRSVCSVVCVVSWAFWPFYAGVLVWRVLCCVCGVLGHLVRVLRCRGVLRCVWCLVCGVACAVSWASRPLFTGAHARFVVLCGQCPGPPGSGGLFGVLCVVCGVLGPVAPVHRCACSVCCVVCGVGVWARARVRHTVAATLRPVCFCLHMARHRGERRCELATGFPATTASGFLWCLTYSSRPGLFGFGDAQE